MKPVFKHLVLTGLLATAGFSALAQNQSPDKGPDDARPGMHRMDPAKMEEMHAKRNAELKAKLKITSAQEVAWSSFTNAIKPPAPTGKPPLDRAELEKLPTPERLDKLKALRNQHVAAENIQIEQRDQAVKTFYSALSAEQQKVFDAEFFRPSHPHDMDKH